MSTKVKLVGFVIPLLALTACAENPPARDESSGVQWQRISSFGYVSRLTVNGVDCVVYDGPDGAGGVSCDWSQR